MLPPPALDAAAVPESRRRPQAIVIGSGFGGLAAAVRLGARGYRRREKARTAERAGILREGGRRGRPGSVRRGEPRGRARLDLIATLRAAAPWQALRRQETPHLSAAVLVRREDPHVTQFSQRSETTTIFAVDASGSAALHRLAETKGAVELLLADCYVRRDSVAHGNKRGIWRRRWVPATCRCRSPARRCCRRRCAPRHARRRLRTG